MRRRKKMSRANIFSFFSKKNFLSDKGRKGNFFLWDFLLLQMCGIIIFVFFFYFFHYLFVFSYVFMQQLTQKNCHCGCVFILFFPSGFYVLGFFKRKFFCFFWFHSFFLFVFVSRFFYVFIVFFLSGEGEDSQKLTFFQNWHKKITLKITKNKQIDALCMQ